MKVALCLEETGLPYELKPVDTRKGEQHRPEFLALNPNGKVPVIVDQETGATVFDRSGKNLGHYAASWVACWPRPKRPSSTAALTWSTRWAPRGDQRICPRLFMRALTRLLTVPSARDVEIGFP